MIPKTLKIRRDCFNFKLMQFVEKIIDGYMDGSYHFFSFQFEHFDKGNKFIIDGEIELRDDFITVSKASDTADEFSGVGCYLNEIKSVNQYDLVVLPDLMPHDSLQTRFEKLLKDRYEN